MGAGDVRGQGRQGGVVAFGLDGVVDLEQERVGGLGQEDAGGRRAPGSGAGGGVRDAAGSLQGLGAVGIAPAGRLGATFSARAMARFDGSPDRGPSRNARNCAIRSPKVSIALLMPRRVQPPTGHPELSVFLPRRPGRHRRLTGGTSFLGGRGQRRTGDPYRGGQRRNGHGHLLRRGRGIPVRVVSAGR